jgi:hypothetical protein
MTVFDVRDPARSPFWPSVFIRPRLVQDQTPDRATNSAGSTGLITCVWNLASSAFVRSWALANAVSAMAGNAPGPRLCSHSRSLRIRLMPSSSGMERSEMRMSGRGPVSSVSRSSASCAGPNAAAFKESKFYSILRSLPL